MVPFFVLLFVTCIWSVVALAPSQISEGSLLDMEIAPTQASKPGSTPGFYNPRRRIGRDFVVLSVAQWLAAKASSSSNNSRPARLLDATCATGIQGLRTAVESPLLARAMISNTANNDHHDQGDEPPELHVVLNDMDEDAANLAENNTASVQLNQNYHGLNVKVTRRVAQALMHEETFEVSVLDPFGSVQPFLDAALARAPHGGLIEVCATDVGVLYGTRPTVAARHYHGHLAHKRPPCYRERGVRLLLAAIAQAAGRHDRGVVPVYAVSTEHFCLVSVKVVRRAQSADATAKQVQRLRICRTCGAVGTEIKTGQSKTIGLPQCDCDPIDGAGSDAQEEGPLWVGPLYDVDMVQGMAEISRLEEARGLISKETCNLLEKMQQEAVVKSMFHRRPGVAAGGKIPKLVNVMEELRSRSINTSRTHFCTKSLKSDASPEEFDDAVKAVLAREEK